MATFLVNFFGGLRKKGGGAFLDALAFLDFMLSISQSLSGSFFSSIKASASTGLSELF